MKMFKRKTVYVLMLVTLLILGAASVIRTSRARVKIDTPAAIPSSNPIQVQTMDIVVTNNTTGDIKHLFLSPPDSDNWSADQLNDSAIAAGHSFTITNASCAQANVKVIAEDASGCFIYKTVSCSESTSWVIPNDAARDCGN